MGAILDVTVGLMLRAWTGRIRPVFVRDLAVIWRKETALLIDRTILKKKEKGGGHY